MYCRPLLPLLALAALLALPPACRALSCYQCSDQTGQIGDEGSSGLHNLPSCAEFDEDDNKYQQKLCTGTYDKTCSKVTFKNGNVIRGCFKEKPEGCNEENEGLNECFCTSDYCNSAGVTAPALLLLLPAALMAALYTA